MTDIAVEARSFRLGPGEGTERAFDMIGRLTAEVERLRNIISTIDDPYPTSVFTDVMDEELAQVAAALADLEKAGGPSAVLDRLHAQWARHLAQVTVDRMGATSWPPTRAVNVPDVGRTA